MSYKQEQSRSASKTLNNDYFSRPLSRETPPPGDLITFGSDEEPHDNDTDALSPVQSDLLTPATLSPPLESTERSPLLSPTLPNHASISAPVVCCRAGVRPANIPLNNTNPPLFPTGPPQNMGGQPALYGTHVGHDLERNKRRRKQRGRWCGSKYSHRWMAAIGLLAVLFAIQQYISCERDSTSSSPGPAGPTCSLPYCSANLTHSFTSTESFSFSEDFHAQSLPVRGTIWLEPAPADQSADVSLVMSYASSSEKVATKPRWELEGSSVRLLPPAILSKRAPLASIFGTCLSVGVTIYLKPNVNLKNLTIDTTHLSIIASPALFTPGKTATITTNQNQNPTIETTTLTAKSSPIHLPHWSSRKTTLRTVSSAITGTFTLLDLLSLNSVSGSITATITPSEADATHPEPAQLTVSTASGSVQITYPPGSGSGSTLPSREYHTSVSTKSGSIKGSYLHGAATTLTSWSGSIEAEILPFDAASASSSLLRTSSGSGATDINVLDAYRDSGKALAGLHGVHESTGSGSIKLRYPGEWEGKIAAASGSGSISVKGRGVVVDEAGEYIAKRVVAHKGDKGGCSIEARTGSGSIDVLVGSLF